MLTVFPICMDFVKNMHSGIDTDLNKDYVSLKTHLNKILHGAVTFTLSILPIEC